jgi:ACS family hexuronate transporter-like MFS transporter
MRWWIVALVSLGTIVNYLSRNTLGILAPVLKTELGLTTEQYSYVVGAFQAAYTVMQPVCGYILDSLGLKLGFTLFALLWSAASCAHIFAGGWLSLAAFRGWLGFSEAAAIPAGVKAISEWFPARERSVGMGLFNIGTSIGAMLAPPMVAYLEIHYGWRSAFLVTGALGFVFAGIWRFAYHSPPRDGALPRAPRPKVLPILKSRAFWGVGLPRFLFEPAWQTFIFWVPLYLATERGMNIKEIGWFAWMPFLAADLGSLVGGFISPVLIKYSGFGLVQSRLAGLVMGAAIMIAPGCVGFAPTAVMAIALLCIGGFAHQILSGLINTLVTDKFATHEVATASGLAGMAGWTGGLAFSLVIGQLVDHIGFTPVFASLSFFDLIGATIAVLMLREPRTAR